MRRHKLHKILNTRILAIFLTILTMAIMPSAKAQNTVTRMVKNQTLLLDACEIGYGIIVDDGGLTNNYSNNFNGYVQITSVPGVPITLTGSYETESNYDYLKVWDGPQNSTLIANVSGPGSFNLTATSGNMTIYFHSDGNTIRSGFNLQWSVDGGAVSVSNISASEATLSWNTINEASEYTVVCDGTTVGTTTATSYSLTGLTPAMEHMAEVYANNRCSGGRVRFRTLCGTLAIPFTEDFDDQTIGQMPPCWNRMMTYDDQNTRPQVTGLTDGNRYLQLGCGAGNTMGHYSIVMAPISGSQAVWPLRVMLRASHDNTYLIIGACDTTSTEYDEYGFVPIDTVTIASSTQWMLYDSTLTVPAGKNRLAFKMERGMQTSNGRLVYIDNLNLIECGISDIEVTHIDTSSANVAWSTFGAPDITLTVHTAGASTPVQTIPHATSPLTLTNLAPGTRHTVTIAPDCGITLGLPMSTSFVTQELTDYVDVFCGGSVSLNSSGMYILPPFRNLAGKEIIFKYTGSNGYLLYVGLLSYADDPSSFVPLDTLTCTYDVWKWAKVAVPADATQSLVAFRTYSYVNINNIQVDTNLLLMTPDSVTTIKSTRATIVWDSIDDGECDSVTIAYAPYSYFDINTSTRITVGNTNHITLEGLTPGTKYGYMLFRACSPDPCNNYPSTFTTPYIDADFPYCENFESEVVGVNTWYAISGNSIYRGTEHAHNGTYSLRMTAYGSGSNGSTLAIPEIDLPQEDVFISFYALTNVGNAEISCGGQDDYSNSGISMTNHVSLIGDGRWHRYTMQVPNNYRYILLRYALTSYSSQSYYVWIDDVQISTDGYSDFELSNLTDTSVTVNFTTVGGTTALQVTLIGGDDTIVRTGTTPGFVIDSLVPDTRYDCYVQSIGSVVGCEEYAIQMSTPPDTNCSRVTFNSDGNSIICHTHANYADYILTVTANGDSVIYHVTDTLFSVDNLLPSTTYTIHYCCSYMLNGCMNDTTVTTGAVPIPYCVLSSDLNHTIPAGWRTVASSASSYTQSYSSYMYMYNSNSRWMYLLLPEFDSTEHLMLQGRLTADCRAVEIGVLTNGDDTSSFVAAITYGNVNNSYRINSSSSIYPRVDLSSLPRGRVAIRFSDNGLYVYQLSLYNMPLAHYSLYRYNYLTVWTEDSTADYYLYIGSYGGDTRYVGTSPTNIYLPSIFHYSWETSYSLSQWSDYYRSDCGNQYLSYGRTYLQGLPLCIRGDNVNTSNRPMMYQYSSYPQYRTYDNASRLTFSGTGLQHAVLQDVDIDSVKRLKMSFIHYSTSTRPIVVGVMVDAYDTSTFTPIDTIAANYYGSTWDTAYVDFSSYNGVGRWIAFRYTGTSSYYGYFYVDDIKVNTCISAMKATATLERYNTVVIDVPDTTNQDLPFYAEYGAVGFTSGTGTWVLVDSLPFRLTLPQDSTFDIYFHCNMYDSPDECTTAKFIKTRSLPLDVPSCIDFEECATGVRPAGWVDLGAASAVSEDHAHSGTKSLSVGEILCTPDINIDSLHNIAISLWLRTSHSRDRLVVGVVTNPDDPTSFVPLKILAPSHSGVWEHIYVALSSAPNDAHFIALQAKSPDAELGEQSVFIDDILFSSCAAFGMQVLDANNTGIIIDWEQVGSPSVTIKVSENGHHLSTYYNPEHPLTITPVNPLNSYRFVVTSICGLDTGNCTINYSDSATVVAPGDGSGCVDATNLESSQSYFFTGTYGNPYSTLGVVNYGTMHPDSRHTVCRDTTLRDPRTEGLLRTVPEGAVASLRLGNWSTNDIQPEAEGVVYSLGVDTTNYSLLLLRYAAVLQNPMHSAQDQPRFRLELLDSLYNVIDSNCAFVDFIADRNLGWHEAPDYVLWKDWTAIVIDMSLYHGQQIFVRLTTFDCNEGSHYGYAYFTLECMKKMITAETCGMVDSNRFTAPSGFNYRWYTAIDTTTISTERSIVVPTADMATYYCNLSSIGNNTCNFTLEAYGGPRQPHAACDTTVIITDCHFDVTFINNSVITSDGINPIPTNEQVESFFWDFGNGEVSTSRNGHTIYNTPGTYSVMLVASIGGGVCTDTLIWPITIASPIHPYLYGPDTICHGIGDTLRLYNARPQNTTNWMYDIGLWYLPLTPNTYSVNDNNYTITAIDTFGCTHLTNHTLIVNPSYTHMDTIVLCSPLLPYDYADTSFLEGTTSARYDLNLLTTEDCDSSYHLWLTVNDTSSSTIKDTLIASICDNEYFLFYGTNYNIAGEHINVHIDNSGFCDSIHSLLLEVRLTSASDTMASDCDIFSWYGSLFTDDTITTRTTPNSVNCDSIITLNLTIRQSSDTSIHHSVVENDLPYLWNGVTFDNDTTGSIITLVNKAGCDSIITFSLTVYRNQDTTISRTICEGMLPLSWNGVTFYLGEENPGTNVITLTATIPTVYGADSVVNMNLLVLYNSTYAINDTLLQNNLSSYTPPFSLPASYTQNEADPGLVSLIDTNIVFTNAVGCDSTVHYTLHLWRNYNIADSIICCDDKLPFTWNTINFYSDSTATMTFASLHATDSVVTFHLTVNPTYDTVDSLLICPHRPYIYDSIDYGGPGVYDVAYTTIHGCDSMVHVCLTPRDSAFRLTPRMRLDNAEWQPYDTVLLGCRPALAELNDTSASVSRTWWLWNVGGTSDTVSSRDTLFADTLSLVDIYSFLLIAVDSNGCYDTVQRDSAIHIFQRPESEFQWGPDIVPFHDPKLALKPQATPADSLTYRWLIALSTGDGGYDTLQHDEQQEDGLWHYSWEPLTDTGNYDVALVAYWKHTLTLYDTLTLTVSCTDTAHHDVHIVNTYLQFPSLVTPNGDGNNDTWEVVNLVEMGQYQTNEVWIYNQWGALVFHAKNINSHEQCWDPNATNSPDGTYYFRFSGKGRWGVVKQNGTIEVLR